MRRVLPLLVLLAVLPASADAARQIATDKVVALGPRDFFGGGPVIGDVVVWGARQGNRLALDTVQTSGGVVTRFPGVEAAGPVGDWNLAMGDGTNVAVDATVDDGDGEGHGVLFGGALSDPLGLLTDPAPTPHSGQTRSLFVNRLGVLTIEGRDARPVLTDFSGVRRELTTLPAGAQRKLLTAASTIGAVPVRRDGRREIVVFDLESGAPVHTIPEPLDPPLALGVGADGSVAYVGEAGLWWAPADAGTFTRLGLEPALLTPSVFGARIAFSEVVGNLERPVVVEVGRTPTVLFRGPLTEHVRTIETSGDLVAWATSHCQLLAPFRPRSVTTIPAGPCVRSEVTYTLFAGDRPTKRRPYLRFGLTCATASDGVCDVTVSAYLGRPLARARFHLRAGRERTLRIPLSARALRRLAGHEDRVVFGWFVRDPDGRHYFDFA